MKKSTPSGDEPAASAATKPLSSSGESSRERPTVVGIGASAGGLEALERFFAHVPAATGLAFVVVQHLDPTRKGLMVELLQRGTPMPVVQIKERMPLERDRIHVIPPNHDLSILHGVFHLLPPAEPRGLRLPIDFFFRSLADDQQERAIGVILSGMGGDGTLGLRAIRDRAGIGFVQEPSSASFDGMPASAIAAGLGDVVAPVEELPARIVAYVGRFHQAGERRLVGDDAKRSGLAKTLVLLRAQTGHDFSVYKRTTLYRRIARRMGVHQIERIGDYVSFLRKNPQEAELLFRELLIGVTSFFRDPEAWEALRDEALQVLLRERSSRQPLRAWVPACATGEEAYSLAISFQEAIERLGSAAGVPLQIFATDLDGDAIESARQGIFPPTITADVSAPRLARFFVEVERGFQIAKSIRETVVFAVQNVAMDPPFTKLDLVSCRNLLIYLTSEVQKKLLPVFHYSLNTGGYLFLGSAETVGESGDLFVPVAAKSRLYRRKDSVLHTEPLEFPPAFAPPLPGRQEPRATVQPPTSLAPLAKDLLLRRHTPTAVLTSGKGDVLFVHGRTGRYLEPAAGKANWNIFAMAREGLQGELAGAFHQALRSLQTVALEGIDVTTDGGHQTINVSIHPVTQPEALRGMVLLTFADVETPPPAKLGRRGGKPSTAKSGRRVAELERAIERLRGELQSSREELQSHLEELRSANEELQSSNEELQSTNEELTTSREEMQSLNEELQTVNQELRAKVDELWRSNTDMKNLLDSTDIATLFLDSELRVRRFTSPATGLTKLIAGDVGRPITDIATNLLYPELAEDVRLVLRRLRAVERQVATTDGRWFTANILPYRTSENSIDGVVVTFVDITAARRLEEGLREARSALEKQVAAQGDEIEEAQSQLRRGGRQRDESKAPSSSKPGEKA